MSLGFSSKEDQGSVHSSLKDPEKASNWLKKTLKGILESATADTDLTKADVQKLAENVLKEYTSERGSIE